MRSTTAMVRSRVATIIWREEMVLLFFESCCFLVESLFVAFVLLMFVDNVARCYELEAS